MAMRELERDNLRRRALKCGIKTTLIYPDADIQRDLTLKRGTNGLDFELVCGIGNLAQVLETALTTRLGDDIFNINYGFDGLNALAEETNPIVQRERVRVSIIRTLENEPRIRRILDVQLTGDERLGIPPLGFEPTAFPLPRSEDSQELGASRQMQIYVWCEAVSGDETVVSVQRMGING